jgi:hypothetical protein
MASTFTSIFRFELMGTGDQSDTWGTTLDNQLQLVENAIAKNQPLTVTGGTTTLSTSNGADDQSRSLCLDVSGTLVSNGIIIVPSKSKMYLVRNNTSGAFTLTVKTAAGTGVVISQTGVVIAVYCDGTNVVSLGAGGAIDANTLGGIAASGFFQLAATNVVQKGYSETRRDLTVAASAFTLDCSLAVFNKVVLNAALCTMSVANAVDGSKFELVVKQDATGSRLITYPANFKFANAATPDLSSAPNASDMIVGRYDSGDGVWRCTFYQNINTGGAVGSANIVLDKNEQDVDVWARSGSPAGAVTVTVLIKPGVIISASSTTTGALSLVGFAAGSTIFITNQGYIIGRGGDGGGGGCAANHGGGDLDNNNAGSNGSPGGPAIVNPSTACTITVNNGSGFIWGGGGGGGGGSWSACGNNQAASGGGGGGGAGGGHGGLGGATSDGTPGTGCRAGNGASGLGGRLSAGGAGGANAVIGGTAGNGGAGGANGAAGTAGSTGAFGSGGAAGKAVEYNGGSGFGFSSGSGAPNVKGLTS